MWGNLKSIELLMRSDEPEAIAFVESTLKGIPAGFVSGAIDTIGQISPKAYHAVVASWLGDRDEAVRFAAAGALEHMAEPKAVPATLKQWKVEKAEGVRGRLLRAMAACGPDQKPVAQAVQKTVQSGSETMRIHATVALGSLDDGTLVRDVLRVVLTDAASKVRSTAAYVIATRREQKLLEDLDRVAKDEPDTEAKQWLDAALEVLRGGSGAAFARFKITVLGERAPTEGMTGR
jgi:HEAT repeat protein